MNQHYENLPEPTIYAIENYKFSDQFIRVSDGKYLKTPNGVNEYKIGDKLLIDNQDYEVVPYDPCIPQDAFKSFVQYIFVKRI